ncbi:MAG: hypothetical protein HOK67_06035 [Deltaproteobacteria bacterium]|jgi:hypothetical protein|nr:hypothetical protein [bacterium]MBT6499445.1 hypothetical protein [Deltaproteobacteria bacterium]
MRIRNSGGIYERSYDEIRWEAVPVSKVLKAIPRVFDVGNPYEDPSELLNIISEVHDGAEFKAGVFYYRWRSLEGNLFEEVYGCEEWKKLMSL